MKCNKIARVRIVDFRLDLDLLASCGTMQVCAKLLFVAPWPSGRRGVLVNLSEGSTAAADDREDSTCSLAKCHSARMPCITRLFSLFFREYACLSPRSFYL